MATLTTIECEFYVVACDIDSLRVLLILLRLSVSSTYAATFKFFVDLCCQLLHLSH